MLVAEGVDRACARHGEARLRVLFGVEAGLLEALVRAKAHAGRLRELRLGETALLAPLANTFLTAFFSLSASDGFP